MLVKDTEDGADGKNEPCEVGLAAPSPRQQHFSSYVTPQMSPSASDSRPLALMASLLCSVVEKFMKAFVLNTPRHLKMDLKKNVYCILK